MAWAAGKRVNKGKYKILRVLGQGGFGITYKAEYDLAGAACRVVIKTPNGDLQKANPAQYAEFVELFRKEARTMAGLRNLRQPLAMAQVLDFFEEGWLRKLPCLVMDFISGTSLWDRVEQKGPLPEGVAVAYIWQVGKALAGLHQQKIVHRDAHPKNIMIQGNRATLIDFGLACSIVPTGSAYVNAGFPYFAPPEQFWGDRSPRVDVYTLAASLYFALTGELPQPPYPWPPGLSQGVRDGVMAALQLDAGDRPESMEAWLQILCPGGPPVGDFGVGDVPAGNRGAGVPQPAGEAQKTRPARLPSANPLVAGLRWEDHRFMTVTGVTQVQETPQGLVDNGHRESKRVTRWVEDLGGGVLLPLVCIPAGNFIMGSPDGEVDRFDREGPQHRVNFPREFWMGQCQITQGQWRAVASFRKIARDLNPEPSNFKGDDRRPVENVSWDDAVEFCQRLSQRTGRNYRLPTEAEWEYACRAGTQTPFAFGETITPDLVNYDGNYPYGNAPKGEYRQKTTIVGQFPANSWGLYDMHGNVWEWCLDEWHKSYKAKPEALKQDGSIEWTQAKTNVLPDDRGGTSRVLRGGSWLNDARYCRSALRNWRQRDFSDFNWGFRVLLSSRTS